RDKSSHINGLRRYERRDFQDEITYNYGCAMYRVLRSGHWKSCGQNWKSLWAAEPVNSRTAGQFRRLIRKNRGLPAVRPKSLRIFYTYFPIFNL
ncbi:hypothetical protein, partial [uncultured Dysosmobacter sp.]|uniref:hypothetical protein n=1 Tax=uncultured Dysosmobacter sp. TaxID=2591384 RepID=UPI0026719691